MGESKGKIATFIGSDNYEGGKLAGEFIAKKLGGKGKVAVLEGIPGHETGDSRLKGFREAIKATPGIEVVASRPRTGKGTRVSTFSRTFFSRTLMCRLFSLAAT